MHWISYALGERTELLFEHDALLAVCSWNTNKIPTPPPENPPHKPHVGFVPRPNMHRAPTTQNLVCQVVEHISESIVRYPSWLQETVCRLESGTSLNDLNTEFQLLGGPIDSLTLGKSFTASCLKLASPSR